MRSCGQCGFQIPANSAFCPQCGAPPVKTPVAAAKAPEAVRKNPLAIASLVCGLLGGVVFLLGVVVENENGPWDTELTFKLIMALLLIGFLLVLVAIILGAAARSQIRKHPRAVASWICSFLGGMIVLFVVGVAFAQDWAERVKQSVFENIVAVFLVVFLLALVAITLGAAALWQIKKRGKGRGAGLALSGIITGTLIFLIYLAAVVLWIRKPPHWDIGLQGSRSGGTRIETAMNRGIRTRSDLSS